MNYRKHIKTLLLVGCLLAPTYTSAQSLLPDSPEVALAKSIDKNQASLFVRIERSILVDFKKVATGDQAQVQAKLDAWGDKAATLVTRYEKTRQLLVDLDPSVATRLPDAAASGFVKNLDGTVTYTPPAP